MGQASTFSVTHEYYNPFHDEHGRPNRRYAVLIGMSGKPPFYVSGRSATRTLQEDAPPLRGEVNISNGACNIRAGPSVCSDGSTARTRLADPVRMPGGSSPDGPVTGMARGGFELPPVTTTVCSRSRTVPVERAAYSTRYLDPSGQIGKMAADTNYVQCRKIN